MILASSAIDFKKYYWIEFFVKFNSKLQNDLGDSQTYTLFSELIDWLTRNDEYMESVEILAAVEHSSEITIFLIDLLEKLDLVESDEMMEILESQTNDFCELFVLLSEEDYFVEAISGFMVNTNKTGDDENEVNETLDDASDDLSHKESEHKDLVDDFDEANEEKIAFTSALQYIILGAFPDSKRCEKLLDELVTSNENREAFKNLLLPGEIQNIITLVNEVFNFQKVNIYSNINIIISNLNNISDDFWAGYEKNDYSVKKAFANDEQSAIHPFTDVKKITKKPVSKIDPEIKEKLKTYFLNDVQENLQELKNIIISIPDYEKFDLKANEVFSVIISIRDMASIHGYEALEIVMVEFYKLIKDAIKEHLVITEETKEISQEVHDKINELLKNLEEDNEKSFVDTVFISFNKFNETLALIEYSDESTDSDNSKEEAPEENHFFKEEIVQGEFWAINKNLLENNKIEKT
jgi:hypothetical protein